VGRSNPDKVSYLIGKTLSGKKAKRTNGASLYVSHDISDSRGTR
jgi:hypothetical protein